MGYKTYKIITKSPLIIIYHYTSSYIIIYHHISPYIIIIHHTSSYIKTKKLTPSNGDTVAQLQIAKAEGGLHLYMTINWNNDNFFFGKSTYELTMNMQFFESSPAGKGRGPQQTSRRRWRAKIKVVIRIIQR